MNETCVSSGRIAIACPPRTARASRSVTAIGHSSWRIGEPSGQSSRSEPHHTSPMAGRRPQNVAAAALKNVIIPSASVVYTATPSASRNCR